MPFGIHFGIMMEDVPADYLLCLRKTFNGKRYSEVYEKGGKLKPDRQLVKEYIDKNIDRITKEFQDGKTY